MDPTDNADIRPIEYHGLRQLDKAHHRAEVLVDWILDWPGYKSVRFEGLRAKICDEEDFDPQYLGYDDLVQRLYDYMEDCHREVIVGISHLPGDGTHWTYSLRLGMGRWTF